MKYAATRVLAIAIVLLLGLVLATGPSALGAQAMKKLRVGMVYDVGGKGDLSFNDMAYAGLSRAQKDFGSKVEVKDLEPTAGGENREELLRLLAGEKYDLIFGIGFLFTDAITNVAKQFRGVKFGIIDGFVDKEPNVSSLLFSEHEGSFLVGAAAALKSTLFPYTTLFRSRKSVV